MRLHNKNEVLRILVFSCFILIAEKVLANDSLYVKFIDKKIDLKEYGFYGTVKVKKILYLFCQGKSDSIINCFVFKKNGLISSGRLTIQKKNELFVAERNGYWNFFDSKRGIEKIYFDDDEPLKEDELPINESNNDFNIK